MFGSVFLPILEKPHFIACFAFEDLHCSASQHSVHSRYCFKSNAFMPMAFPFLNAQFLLCHTRCRHTVVLHFTTSQSRMAVFHATLRYANHTLGWLYPTVSKRRCLFGGGGGLCVKKGFWLISAVKSRLVERAASPNKSTRF